MNNVQEIGRLCADPESRESKGGLSIANIRIAVNERKKDGDDWVDDTTFIDCKAFGSKAEFISGHFRKGDPIWLTGRLSNDEWDDKETGKKRSKLEVLIGQCGFVPSKKDNSDSEFG